MSSLTVISTILTSLVPQKRRPLIDKLGCTPPHKTSWPYVRCTREKGTTVNQPWTKRFHCVVHPTDCCPVRPAMETLSSMHTSLKYALLCHGSHLIQKKNRNAPRVKTECSMLRACVVYEDHAKLGSRSASRLAKSTAQVR